MYDFDAAFTMWLRLGRYSNLKRVRIFCLSRTLKKTGGETNNESADPCVMHQKDWR